MMLKYLIYCLFLIYAVSTYGQKISAGAGLVFGLSGINVDAAEIGIEADIGYNFNDLIKIRFTGGGYISDFVVETHYTDKQSYYLGYFEGAFIYFPVKTFGRPYAGIGGGYYWPHNVTPGNGHRFGDYLIQPKDLKNGAGINLVGGIETISEGLVSFDLEFKYLILKSRLSATLLGLQTKQYNDIETNLNMLTIKIGIRFNFYDIF